jgi:nitronate monooxygenase
MSLLTSLEGRLSLPAIAAPLFIISVPDLVVAQCTAGVVGSMPSLNARPAEQFEEWVVEIRERLAAHDARHPERPAAPFAINLIVHRSNDRLEQDLAVCVKHRVPIVITSLGARPEVNEAVHSYGGHVLHDVINQTFARKAVEKGADGLVLVAAGAGGHAGALSPFALVRETRAWFDGPLALSGAISHGASILARISGTSAAPSSPRPRPGRWTSTSGWSWTTARRTSSTPTSSPACTATISSRRSASPASTRTTCRPRTPRR